MPLGKIVPAPPKAPDDPPGYTSLITGIGDYSKLRPSERPVSRPRPADMSHADFATSAFHFTWRHLVFFWVVVACIGVALMIVAGGAR